MQQTKNVQTGSGKVWFESDEFREKYHYDGPLGAFCSAAVTEFYLWAPTAERVTLYLYTDGAEGESAGRILLDRKDRGVWYTSVPKNLDGIYYEYSVLADGEERRSGDPYARACGINGQRSMVIDLKRTDPENWDLDTAPAKPNKDVIYELHVRDFSDSAYSGIREEWKGKFMALTQEHTTLDRDGIHATGLDYLKQLGVTHIQLLPVYDYGSIDEWHPRDAYNWGYDPLNYNVPEGSYSTDAQHGETRIRELKEAIASLHRHGFRVIMDVVYNHTYSLDSCLFKTVPWYFYRQHTDGTISNGSGCGNDLATERSMCTRYILDSVMYWTEEYHMDGYRFDLMGLMDVPLMQKIRKRLDERFGKDEKLIYGEPWGAATTAVIPGTILAQKDRLADMHPGIAAFCDATRDAIKGSLYPMKSRGMINGGEINARLLDNCLRGWTGKEDWFSVSTPSQIINYLSCHDDWTLWDKLVYAMDPRQRFELALPEILRANRMAVVLLSVCSGHMFFLAGEEFGRTKNGIKNSFVSPISINRLDWERAWNHADLVDYYSGLIHWVQKVPAFGDLNSREGPVWQPVEQVAERCFTTTLKDPHENALWKELYMIINAGEKNVVLQLPECKEGWQPVIDEKDTFLWKRLTENVRGMTVAAPVSVKIFGKRNGK